MDLLMQKSPLPANRETKLSRYDQDRGSLQVAAPESGADVRRALASLRDPKPTFRTAIKVQTPALTRTGVGSRDSETLAPGCRPGRESLSRWQSQFG